MRPAPSVSGHSASTARALAAFPARHATCNAVSGVRARSCERRGTGEASAGETGDSARIRSVGSQSYRRPIVRLRPVRGFRFFRYSASPRGGGEERLQHRHDARLRGDVKRGGAGVVFRGDVHVVQAGQRVHQMEVPAARGEVQARPPAAAAEGILSTRNPFVRRLNLRARRRLKIPPGATKAPSHLRARGERRCASVASLVARE